MLYLKQHMDDMEGKPVIGRKSRPPEQQIWLLGGGAVLAVIVIVVLVVLVINSGNPKNKAVDSARQSATEATEKGDYAKALRDLQQLEGTAMSKEQKIRLYGDLAAAAANNNKKKEAIEYLLQKQQLDPANAREDAYMLAKLYEDMGDTANALAQYKIALEYAKSQSEGEVGSGKVEFITAAIERLQGSAQ